MDWKTYQRKTKNRKHSPLLEEALGYVMHRGVALDFGAGSLVDSKYLLSQGFERVVALDGTSIGTIENPRFTHSVGSFRDFLYPKKEFDIVHGHYSFPFIAPYDFNNIWNNLYLSLKEEGIITGEFFGIHDEWHEETFIVFQSKEQARFLLKFYKIIHLEEKQFDRKTADGIMKHWHIISFIAKKSSK